MTSVTNARSAGGGRGSSTNNQSGGSHSKGDQKSLSQHHAKASHPQSDVTIHSSQKGVTNVPQATTEQIRIAQLINNNKDEPEVQAKCQQIMDVTGRDLEDTVVALHDHHGDMERAIMYLLEQGDEIETEWKTSGPKKKPKNKLAETSSVSTDNIAGDGTDGGGTISSLMPASGDGSQGPDDGSGSGGGSGVGGSRRGGRRGDREGGRRGRGGEGREGGRGGEGRRDEGSQGPRNVDEDNHENPRASKDREDGRERRDRPDGYSRGRGGANVNRPPRFGRAMANQRANKENMDSGGGGGMENLNGDVEPSSRRDLGGARRGGRGRGGGGGGPRGREVGASRETKTFTNRNFAGGRERSRGASGDMSIDTWTPAAPVGNANHESDNVVKMDEWTNDMANGTVGANQSTQPDGLKVIGQWSNKDAMMEVHPPPASHAPAASAPANARSRVPSAQESSSVKAPPTAIGNHRQPQHQPQPQHPPQWAADADEYDDAWTGSLAESKVFIASSIAPTSEESSLPPVNKAPGAPSSLGAVGSEFQHLNGSQTSSSGGNGVIGSGVVGDGGVSSSLLDGIVASATSSHGASISLDQLMGRKMLPTPGAQSQQQQQQQQQSVTSSSWHQHLEAATSAPSASSSQFNAQQASEQIKSAVGVVGGGAGGSLDAFSDSTQASVVTPPRAGSMAGEETNSAGSESISFGFSIGGPSQRVKVAKSRVPPPSTKIPSSAVEMPGGNRGLAALEVQFGALDFGFGVSPVTPPNSISGVAASTNGHASAPSTSAMTAPPAAPPNVIPSPVTATPTPSSVAVAPPTSAAVSMTASSSVLADDPGIVGTVLLGENSSLQSVVAAAANSALSPPAAINTNGKSGLQTTPQQQLQQPQQQPLLSSYDSAVSALPVVSGTGSASSQFSAHVYNDLPSQASASSLLSQDSSLISAVSSSVVSSQAQQQQQQQQQLQPPLPAAKSTIPSSDSTSNLDSSVPSYGSSNQSAYNPSVPSFRPAPGFSAPSSSTAVSSASSYSASGSTLTNSSSVSSNISLGLSANPVAPSATSALASPPTAQTAAASALPQSALQQALQGYPSYGSQSSVVNPYVYGSQSGQTASTSHYGSYGGVPNSKLALSPDASVDSSTASLYADPSVVAGIGAMPLSQLQNQVSSASNLSQSVSLDSVNAGLGSVAANAAAATAVSSSSSLQQQQQLIGEVAAAAAASSSTTPSTTTSLTTSMGGSVVGSGSNSTQLPMTTAGASSSSLGAGFGTTMSAGTASKAPPNLQMPIMNHQYLVGHGMPQFAYGLHQQPIAPTYGYEDMMMSQRFPVFQPSSSMHAHLAAAVQGRTTNGTSTPGASAASSSSSSGSAATGQASGVAAAASASTATDSMYGSAAAAAVAGSSTGAAPSTSDRYSTTSAATRNGDDASPTPTNVAISSAQPQQQQQQQQQQTPAGSVNAQPFINTALPPGYHAYGTAFPSYMMPQYTQYAAPMYPAAMPPVTNNHSATGYGKGYSGSYSTGRYDHADSLSAGDYKSAYGNATLSGSAGKLSSSSVSSTVGENLSGSSGYASSSAVASSSKTSLQIQQTAGGYGSEGSKVQVATGQAYHHPQHAANTPPPPNALAAYMANLAGQQTLGGAPVAAPQAAYPSYLPTMMQPTTGHHLLQQLQETTRSTPNQTKMSTIKQTAYAYNWNSN